MYVVVYLLSFFSMTGFAQQVETEIAYSNYHRYFSEGQKVKNEEKEKFIQQFRQNYAKNITLRYNGPAVKLSVNQCLDSINDDGQFIDVKREMNGPTKTILADFLERSFARLRFIALAHKKAEVVLTEEQQSRFLKSILFYGKSEIARKNIYLRFHVSCFALPVLAADIYFSFFKEMEMVEAGNAKNPLLVEACDMLKVIGLQAYTQPFRNDSTDKNVVSVDRFRNNVWWVGGNALDYRPLLPVALMYRSIPMIDVVSDVSQKALSTVSQNTYTSAFWTEGFTADGAGWGHGRQSHVWGYPIDGTSAAIKTLTFLKGSPWAKQLSRDNVNALLNFIRGSNWYYYKGYRIPGNDRMTMAYNLSQGLPRTIGMAQTLIKEFDVSLTPAELSEMKQFNDECKVKNINMSSLNDGVYSGTRWFFNNDDLFKKNANYHIMVNMASVRCDGLESMNTAYDNYNFFTDDGSTLFQKNGLEYRKVFGGWDVTATPGVTAREGMDKLTPVTHWRGYCSKFNFAGAATLGGENAVAGFNFEKMDAFTKYGTAKSPVNDLIYGIQVHKGYFILGDYFIALGAGVNNLNPEMEGTIRTTIDQTSRDTDIVILKNGKEEPLAEGVQQSFFVNGKPVWVMQKNKFAYTLLPEYSANAYFINENKKADWAKMHKENENIKNIPTNANILRLWIDHGQKVNNGTYGYVVYAGDKTPDKKLPFQVLRNDTLIQAIQSIDKRITEAVFYSANTKLVSKRLELSASAPCVVLIEEGKECILSVNDPLMNPNLKQLKLYLRNKELTIDMPQGELCGNPAKMILKKIDD